MTRRLTDDILPLIEAGALVLTVNNRLARSLVSAYDQLMAGRGLGAWPTPVVMPVDAWISRAWNASFEGMAAPVIDRYRAEAAWEDIVAGDSTLSAESRAGAGTLASTAYSAYGLVAEYNITVPEGIYTTEETRALGRWSKEYDRRVASLGLVDINTAKRKVVELVSKGSVEMPRAVVFAGFDEPSPTVTALREAMTRTGIDTRFLPDAANTADPAPECEVTIEECADEADEVIRAARWVRANIKPGIRIGIIVPELHRYRDLIEREFSAELDPASALLTRSDARNAKDACFNISLGLSLIDEPLVGAALSVLGTGLGQTELPALISTLTSPYVCPTPNDASALSALNIKLRDDNRTTSTLTELSRRLAGAGATEGFMQAVGRWVDLLKERAGARRPASSWAAMFTELLSAVGFASGITITSAEYQAREAFIDAAETLATLDDILGAVSMTTAHSALVRITKNTIHQGESPDAEVQVLGLLESAGLTFDHVRMLGCHALALPAHPQPNPFLPVYIQREHDLPQSTHERELRFARTVLRRITTSTPSITATYPSAIDERPARPSYLIKDIADAGGAMSADPSNTTNRLKDMVFAARSLEPIPAIETLPVDARELKRIRGGTGIIKEQSACPFRAFAAYRLKAVAVPDTVAGLHPKHRGIIAHNAMKSLWEGLGTSKALKAALADGTISGVITRSVDAAFNGIRVDAPLSDRYLAIERERLAGVITEWLGIEAERKPFKAMKLEDTITITLSGLTIRGRIDRVDECEDGSRILIDYKTGRSSVSDWLPPRPPDPQLPMYTTADRYDAVAFAALRTGECGFCGVSRTNDMLPKVKSAEENGAFEEITEAATGDKWQALLGAWRKTVEGLASDFVAGRAEAAPNPALKGWMSPCSKCEYKPLCRVLDTIGAINIDDDE